MGRGRRLRARGRDPAALTGGDAMTAPLVHLLSYLDPEEDDVWCGVYQGLTEDQISLATCPACLRAALAHHNNESIESIELMRRMYALGIKETE